MAKPNKDCPKCHGTGWEPKPGTLSQRPCPDCSKVQQLPQFGQGRPMVSSLDQFKKPAALFRYFWATHMVKANGWTRVIDAACGCGYGSWLFAEYGGAEHVLGIDVDAGAIEVAETYWRRPGVAFDLKDILDPDAPVNGAADVVVSLETIEHIAEPRKFLERFREWAPNLVATVPDEDMTPFDPHRFPFHYTHYRLSEFRELLLEFYDEVNFFVGVEEWTKLVEAKSWLEAMSPGERGQLLGKLQGNLRVVARSVP